MSQHSPRILLIPTSDSVITNWIDAYKPLQKEGVRVFIICDSEWVSPDAKTPFTSIDLDLSRRIRAAGRGYRRTALQWKLIRKAAQIFKENQIDAVIVSNDNDPVTNAFVNTARSGGIRTVLHQAAGLMYLTDDPTHPANIKTPPPWWMRRFLGFTTDGRIGGHVDECWTQGPAWAPYLHNDHLYVVGNAYYRQLQSTIGAVTAEAKETFMKQHGLDPTKPTVTFYSQPFGKLGLLDSTTLPIFYSAIAQLAESLHPHTNTVFKSHPLETEHREYLDTTHLQVIDRCDLTALVASSPFAVSVFSAMAIQSRIAGATTLGYHPPLFHAKHTRVMAEAFHHCSENIDDIAKRILSPSESQTPSDDFQNKFDLNANTSQLIADHLARLTKS